MDLGTLSICPQRGGLRKFPDFVRVLLPKSKFSYQHVNGLRANMYCSEVTGSDAFPENQKTWIQLAAESQIYYPESVGPGSERNGREQINWLVCMWVQCLLYIHEAHCAISLFWPTCLIDTQKLRNFNWPSVQCLRFTEPNQDIQ